MPRKGHIVDQIDFAMKQVENGAKVPEVSFTKCPRIHGW